ncbi:MAG: sigma-54 dependent transcriptional regulator [Gammaproteobacteria bacterium]|nr:sigma-54 dependent transcriptional regulator [Gammaproteobacteria bacterium]
MTQYTALIVDDEPDILELLEVTLSRMEINTITAGTLNEAKQAVTNGGFDLCLTDMKLPDGDGIELIEFLQKQHPEIPIAMFTAHGNMDTAIKALKSGAFDFVSKPVDINVLRNLITTALKLANKQDAITSDSPALLGNSPAIEKVRKQIDKLARSQAPVYISGESGSGKELAARMIHENGARSDKPFMPVNCGAIPENLIESELFGHKKGSFTGATSDKEGLFKAADGGTLFLDEIADLPLHMQVKLLRAIQEKKIRPVGHEKEIPIDVRILSATHKDLKQMVDAGEFRQDLFYRLNVIELPIPALREHTQDIPLLAEHFLALLGQETNETMPVLSQEAITALQSYPFPGNVRELENILERAMTLCENNQITAQDLQLPENSQVEIQQEMNDTKPLDSKLDNIEKEQIVKALQETKYNRTKAAELLGMSYRSLRYRLKKLGIE